MIFFILIFWTGLFGNLVVLNKTSVASSKQFVGFNNPRNVNDLWFVQLSNCTQWQETAVSVLLSEVQMRQMIDEGSLYFINCVLRHRLMHLWLIRSMCLAIFQWPLLQNSFFFWLDRWSRPVSGVHFWKSLRVSAGNTRAFYGLNNNRPRNPNLY